MQPIPYYLYDNVKIGQNVSIHPYAVIGKPPQVPESTAVYKPKLDGAVTVIGDGCVIGAGAVIYQGCVIGNNTLIGDGARLRDRAIVGDNCIIGMGTKIGPQTRIGNKVKIMDLCNIAGNMIIEDCVFISQGTMCTNDKYMGRVKMDTFKGPIIRKHAAIGANTTILPGLEIGENAVVGAGAIIAEDVPKDAVVMCNKARLIRIQKQEKDETG